MIAPASCVGILLQRVDLIEVLEEDILKAARRIGGLWIATTGGTTWKWRSPRVTRPESHWKIVNAIDHGSIYPGVTSLQQVQVYT